MDPREERLDMKTTPWLGHRALIEAGDPRQPAVTSGEIVVNARARRRGCTRGCDGLRRHAATAAWTREGPVAPRETPLAQTRPSTARGIVMSERLIEKLAILADAAKYDASCASSGAGKRNSLGSGGIGSTEGMGICHSYTPDGRCVSLLKILLTNFCVYDCPYCINRRSSDVRRARFTPQEVVRLTLDFYKRNYIEGLFLVERHRQERRLHDGAAGRGGAVAARGPPLPRLHPPQDDPGSVAGTARAGRAVRRPTEHQRRTADRGGVDHARAGEDGGEHPRRDGRSCAGASTKRRKTARSRHGPHLRSRPPARARR